MFILLYSALAKAQSRGMRVAVAWAMAEQRHSEAPPPKEALALGLPTGHQVRGGQLQYFLLC